MHLVLPAAFLLLSLTQARAEPTRPLVVELFIWHGGLSWLPSDALHRTAMALGENAFGTLFEVNIVRTRNVPGATILARLQGASG